MSSKMILCKTCRNPLAKNAKVCPHCGAKNKAKTGVQVFLGIFIAFMVIGFIATVSDSGSSGETVHNETSTISASTEGTIVEGKTDLNTKPIPEEPQYIEVTAADLYETYQENVVNGDLLYKGKSLAVTGVIDEIGQGIIFEEPCISLTVSSSYIFGNVDCFFIGTDDQLEEIAKLKDGDTVTIYGKCTGLSIYDVQLSNCKLTK